MFNNIYVLCGTLRNSNRNSSEFLSKRKMLKLLSNVSGFLITQESCFQGSKLTTKFFSPFKSRSKLQRNRQTLQFRKSLPNSETYARNVSTEKIDDKQTFVCHMHLVFYGMPCIHKCEETSHLKKNAQH